VDPGAGTTTLTGLVATINADGTTTMDASNFIYAAQASYGSSIITLSNTGASTWQDLAVNGQSFQNVISPYVVDDIIAYISAGFAFGFVGSEVINPMTGNAFGDDPSSTWFANGQTLAFADVQPDSPYYSLYSKLLNEASSHVYSHPYSDRFQDPIFQNSISLTTGDVMEIHFYDFDAVPEPSTYALILGGLGCLAGARYLRGRRV
jgi:hypothetical protein